jgi:hypothetical protein
LQGLQPGEFAHCRAAAEKSPKPIARPALGIKFQKIRLAAMFESPNLAIPAVLYEPAKFRQIAQRGF